jgi:hypothetical protein
METAARVAWWRRPHAACDAIPAVDGGVQPGPAFRGRPAGMCDGTGGSLFVSTMFLFSAL